MFSEADEVDVADPKLSFVFGRRSEPAQPQIPRFRAAAAKSETFVAILANEEQVWLAPLAQCNLKNACVPRAGHLIKLYVCVAGCGPPRQGSSSAGGKRHVGGGG